MRLAFFGAFAALVMLVVSTAYGQTALPAGNPPATASKAASALEQAAAAQKYAFVFFWKERNAQTDQAWQTLQGAAGKFADRAVITSVSISDPAEKSLVDRFGASRAPMPLVLAVAPCGVVTKGFTGRISEAQLKGAFVSPCAEKCLKGIQDGKLVFLLVHNSAAPLSPAAIQGVQDFQADSRYKGHTEVVQLNSAEPAEASFLKEFQIAPETPQPVTVFLAPPGNLVGKFAGPVSKEQLVAKLQSAQSGCCPGGKCGPGGCGPKK